MSRLASRLESTSSSPQERAHPRFIRSVGGYQSRGDSSDINRHCECLFSSSRGKVARINHLQRNGQHTGVWHAPCPIPSVKNRDPQCRSDPSRNYAAAATRRKYEKALSPALLTRRLAIPSFASDVVVHSVKVGGKDSAKAATVTAKESAKAVKAVGKFLFRP